MKSRLIILILVIIYFACSSRSCSDDNAASLREKNVASTVDSIKEVFTTDHLTESVLYTYEHNAKQKLYDIAEYCNILNDTSADLFFRQKAAGLIRSAFFSGKSFVVLNSAGTKMKTLDDYISDAFDNKNPMSHISLEKVSTIEAITRINDTLYSGNLAYRFSEQKSENKSFESNKHFNGTVKVYVTKIPKNFGNDSFRVWTVLLENMD
jgi:hypothetical protein